MPGKAAIDSEMRDFFIKTAKPETDLAELLVLYVVCATFLSIASCRTRFF